MARKSSPSPIIFFVAGSLLLSGGALTTSFPIFIFFGFAPLFALTDRAGDTSTVWEKMEWVLLALTLYFLAIHSFDFSYLISSMIYGIVFTLPFIAHVWVRQTLGQRAGKITLILFWLALEYAALKISPGTTSFLADTLLLHADWTRWNIHTGYLGASLWILIANLMVYNLFLSESRFRWYWIVLTVIFLLGPVAWSWFSDLTAITRKDLVKLYVDKLIIEDVTYLARGELIVRTAAWISTLILLFTFVKSQTTKR
ncbi:hypothetical protein BH10BAC4_BH10BAC4_17650 [soil metagenome]